ncbi:MULTISPECIES: RNA-guided endonuclease TnpB family protein [unclassified Kitasatospora]|uniref:RNA-guided endonuclease TnpB family protein n=1 Tax=unclassified Kitasatospora TaxID=2633591 RepID=UPI00381DF837
MRRGRCRPAGRRPRGRRRRPPASGPGRARRAGPRARAAGSGRGRAGRSRSSEFLRGYSRLWPGERLVRENQTIVIEDLTVRNMLRNRTLARAVSDAGWAELRSMLEYKADWYGRDLVAVDRWFPSSELCSASGILRGRMPLNVREWTCGCGATHDRDVNAARNIVAAGLAVAACGGGARPQRSTPGGRSSVKQEVVPPPRSRAAAQPRG